MKSFKKFLLFGLCVLFAHSLLSQKQQKIDSLVRIAEQSPLDTNLVKTYQTISRMYLSVQLDSAKVYAQKMIDNSKKLGYDKGVAMGNNWLGEAYNIQGHYDTALHYFNKTRQIFKANDDTKNWVLALSVIANVYAMTNKHDSAMVLYQNAIDHFEKVSDPFSAAKMQMNLAKLYSRKGEYDAATKLLYQSRLTLKTIGQEDWFILSENAIATLYGRQEKSDSAIAVFKRVAKYYEKVENQYWLGETYSNIGAIFEGNNQLDSALSYYDKSLSIRKNVNDPRGLAISEMNYGGLLLKMEKYDSVLPYLDRSRAFFESNKNLHPLSYNLLLIGKYYATTKQYEKARDTYIEAYKLADQNQILDDLPEAALGLSIVYEKLMDFENAYNYSKIYKTHYDSLTNEEIIRSQTIAEENYKHQLQLYEKEKEISFERKQKYFLMFIIIVGVLLLVLIILYRRKLQATKILQLKQQNQINLQNARLQSQMDERKRVANILHDNLAHVILNVRSQISKLILKSKDQKQKDKLVQVEENLDFMNKLAKVASYELDFYFVLEDNIINQIDKYIKRVQHSHAPKISFHHSKKNQFDAMSDDLKVNLFSVFQEMLGNAIKYAKAKHIGISLFRDGEHTTLLVDDDGIGFNYEEERHGQGFKNMKERADTLKGTFAYESEIGFGTKLKFVV